MSTNAPNKTRSCLFCSNKANSKEHVWPQWIIDRLRPQLPIRHVIGDTTPRLINSPALTSKCVCGKCNQGWMHDLEEESKPTLGCLMKDMTLLLDHAQQIIIARWTAKTAIVMESVRGRKHNNFYNKSEREQLRSNSSIPAGTDIWIGRYSKSSFGFDAGGFQVHAGESSPVVANGGVTTMIIGHLAIQIATIHFTQQKNHGLPITLTNVRKGPWSNLLIPIWPLKQIAQWPPLLSFGDHPDFPVESLVHRFKPNTAS